MLSATLSVMIPFLALAIGSPLEERDTCNHDNVLRCLIGAPATATPYCSSYLSKGVVTSYSATTTPTATATTTITVTVTSPAVAKRDFEPATTIYAGSPVTIVGPDATSVVLNRRMVEARATTTKPAPSCLAQYSPPATRLTSACNCLSITSSTLTTVSTAPTTTTTSTTTATTTVAPPPACPSCNVCSSNADCKPGYECDAYFDFSFGDVNLCTTENIQSGSDICSSICT